MLDRKQFLNTNEASKLCGLSPSVLRIWEVRYGWPAPKRKPNGYRAYTFAQVEELKRAAALVKRGTPISALIVDGMPRWPASGPTALGPVRLVQARACLEASPPNDISESLLEAFETRRGNRVIELLQRAIIALRPREEVAAVLVPALVAQAELAKTGRHMQEEAEIRAHVRERAIQLLRSYHSGDEADWVVAANEESQALAAVVALLLNQQDRPARYWSGTELPDKGRTLVVGGFDCTVCSALGVMPGVLQTSGSNQPPGNPDPLPCQSASRLAAQQEIGLLSKQRPRSGSRHPGDAAAPGTTLDEQGDENVILQPPNRVHFSTLLLVVRLADQDARLRFGGE